MKITDILAMYHWGRMEWISFKAEIVINDLSEEVKFKATVVI